MAVHIYEGVETPLQFLRNEVKMMKQKKKVLWGDIYYCDLGEMKGSVQCGKRPVIVIQNNRLNYSSPTVTVAVITTVKKKIKMPSHIIIGKECGLPEESMILLEQTRTVDKNEELLDYIGAVIDVNKRNEIKEGIKLTHGIPTKPRPQRKALVMNLCPRCCSELMNDKDNLIRRINPLQSEKELCSKCHCGYGYEYMVMKKEHKRRSDN